MPRGGFTEEMTSELRPIGSEGVNADLGRKSRLRRGHSMCKSPGAGLYLACWKRTARRPMRSRMNEGDRERGRGQDRSCRALWATWMTWALISREVGPRRVVDRGGGQPEVGPNSGAHGYPLVAALGRTDFGV